MPIFIKLSNSVGVAGEWWRPGWSANYRVGTNLTVSHGVQTMRREQLWPRTGRCVECKVP